jgi:signal transduction histidine kinase
MTSSEKRKIEHISEVSNKRHKITETLPISNTIRPDALTESFNENESRKTIRLSFRDQLQEIGFPESYSQLKAITVSLFKISPEQALEFFDMRFHFYTAQNFDQLKSTSTELLIVTDSDEKNDSQTTQEFIVDITPEKSVLVTAGISEYDIPSAIAELVDNSIQAIRENSIGNKCIKIRLNFNQNDPYILIWDNGKGMTLEELRLWATLGSSQNNFNRENLASERITPYSDKGLISRFGVGAKSKYFFLPYS